METVEPYQYWLLTIALAIIAFQIGRKTAPGSSEAPEARRLRMAQQAEQHFSSLSPSNQTEVDRLLTDGKLIEAVKLIREDIGIGLKEAKDVADHRRRKLNG